MRRQAPPLEATEAFLAGARASSFRAAADAIALSPSAFSRRIQQLEHFVGASLFDRSGPVVRLTEAGSRFYDDVAPAMDTIRRATMQVREATRSRILRLVVSHSLAVGWLVPRLAALRHQHDIEIDLTISLETQALRSGAADLAIWGGRSADGEFNREPLIALAAVAVSAEVLADGQPRPVSVDDLNRHRLLATKMPEHFWTTWLEHMGCEHALAPAMRFETSHLTYEAAASGLGVTLAVPLISARFISERRLLPLLAAPIDIGHDYSLFYATHEVARRPTVRQFVEWLHQEIAKSRLEFDSWASTKPVEM